MNRKVSFLLALILAGVMVFSLAACSFGGIESEQSSELSAHGKEDSLKLLNDFFKQTLQNDNMVITTKNDDALKYTETIDGDANTVVFHESGVTAYSFKQNGEYIAASLEGEEKTYRKGEGAYNAYFRFFYAKIRVLDAADESNTFSCKASDTDLVFEMTGENGNIKITATAKDGLVQSATMTDSEETITQTYTYGSAAVTLPDLTDWEDVTDSGPTEENAD